MKSMIGDEMGLGKTLQTIAFLAHLKDKGIWGPYLIVCPLSVLHNWISEFEKFAPSIPVCMYHGSRDERAELRRTVLRPPKMDDKERPTVSLKGRGKKGRKSTKSKEQGDEEQLPDQTPQQFPVVVTTYEMIVRDSQYLSSLVPNRSWQFIVVDEVSLGNQIVI